MFFQYDEGNTTLRELFCGYSDLERNLSAIFSG